MVLSWNLPSGFEDRRNQLFDFVKPPYIYHEASHICFQS
jgi:hypothetical protein